MRANRIRKPFKKIALVLSICVILIWTALGTGVSLAWFADTSTEIKNIINFSTFKLSVEHRDDDGNWKTVTGDKAIFDENALYEPGYVQIVYLKVTNDGDTPFRFQTAVNVIKCTPSINVYGDVLELEKYLKAGMAVFFDEDEMDMALADRQTANEIADEKLRSFFTDAADLQPGKSGYIALVVRMPEDVDNSANYRGETIPTVELGISVRADQIVE